VQHPIGTVKPEEVKRRADAAFEKLLETLIEAPSNGAEK
jgi:hypothetical protein